jgi:heme A synthase
VLVILFGAVVRITGSGAGCGQHWPTCQGEVAHLPNNLKTAIEFSHRLTSGLSVLVVFGLTIFTVRRTTRGHVARNAAFVACGLMVVESLIGAALVLLRYVGENASVGRAVIMAIHLVSTLALTAVMACAACAFHWRIERLSWKTKGAPLLLFGALGIVVVAAAGAVTALGDTLYPVTGPAVTAALADAQSQSSHFLERMRGLHPLLALAVSGFVLWAAPRVAELAEARGDAVSMERSEHWARAVSVAVLVQLAIGVANVWLSAPGYMQVLHLLAALMVWLCWVTLAFAALSPPASSSPRGPAEGRTLG